MVRREGTRFGVSTCHSVRRSVQSQKAVHSSQNIVVKATADVMLKRAQKQASAVVENHLQNRTLNLKGFSNEAVIPFSLNKNKRWEIIDALKSDIGNVCCHGNRITVSEHHIGVGNPDDNDCTAVYDSMSAKSKCSPNKTYARAADLVLKETEPSTDQVAADDKEFGTKNRRRRQKRRVKVDKRTGIQDEVYAVNVSYAINVAAPKHTLYTFPKRGRSHGMDDGGDENIVLQTTRQGTKKRNKKISRDMYDDLDSLRDFDAEEVSYCSEEDDDQEVTDEPRCIPRSKVTAAFGMFAVAADQQTGCLMPKRNSRPTQGLWTKEHIFQTGFEEPQESGGETYLEVEDNAIVKLSISADNLLPEFLRGEFAEDYQEAYCSPQRFSVDITDRVMSKVREILKYGSYVSDTLCSTGYQVFTFFSLPTQEACQQLDISATVIGERFNQMDAEKVLYGYRDEIKCLSDAVDRIAEVVAYKVKYRCQNEAELNTSHQNNKARGVSLPTIGSSLNWESETETQSQQQMWKQIVTYEEEKRKEENTSEQQVPALYEDHEGACRICFSDVSATFPGTCLQPCNHLCCDECWKGYLIAKVSQGNPHITCPEFNCKVPVDRVTVMSLVPYKLATFHRQQKINATVACDKHLHWCPNTGCGRVARFTDVTSKGMTITCECGFVWCSKCMQETHWPASCVQAAKYRADKAIVLKSVNRENESIIDEIRHKNCPKCNNPIEKISPGFCDVITCSCLCAFCWRCGALISDHDVYKCTQATLTLEIFEFHKQTMEHVYQFSVMHHFKRSRVYSFRRSQRAHKLANRVALALTLDKSSEECDRQAPNSTPTKAAMFSLLRGAESGMKLLEEINDLFKNSSDFLLEAYSVLEFLEILQESSPPCDLKRRLYQHKTRLAFISQQVDDILNLRMLDVRGCVERIRTLLDNGKSCLSLVAKVASDLSDMKEVPINLPFKEY